MNFESVARDLGEPKRASTHALCRGRTLNRLHRKGSGTRNWTGERTECAERPGQVRDRQAHPNTQPISYRKLKDIVIWKDVFQVLKFHKHQLDY